MWQILISIGFEKIDALKIFTPRMRVLGKVRTTNIENVNF